MLGVRKPGSYALGGGTSGRMERVRADSVAAHPDSSALCAARRPGITVPGASDAAAQAGVPQPPDTGGIGQCTDAGASLADVAVVVARCCRPTGGCALPPPLSAGPRAITAMLA